MLTKERVQEMYDKLSGLGPKEVKQVHFDKGGVCGHYGELELDVTIPEVLVGLGVAITEDEAEDFLAQTITAQVVGVHAGVTDTPGMLHDLVKFGFHLGTLAGRTQKGGTN